ncbi:MAG: class I SAM-dependent methyltransferase [Candidatus Aminicenantes bacterium]|nr:MAG: class I SAM-dependent methyltransferase [Candidatus Aminicenantes bacterium]
MTQVSKKVESHFDRKYREFDAFYREKKGFFSRMIDAVFRRSMQLRFEKVIAGAAPYKKRSVLDVGCGTGRYSVALALKGIKRALGIDFASNMIDAANDLARHLNVHHICQFMKADFMAIDFAETFDHVFAMGVLDYVEHPVPLVRKMVDLAERSVMISFPSKKGIVQRFRKQLFRKVKKCPVFFYSNEDVRQIAHQGGAKKFTIDILAKDYFLTIYSGKKDTEGTE